MHTITLKSVPDDLYARLKASAIKNKRSLNKEALDKIEQSLSQERRDPEEILRKVREMQERLNLPKVTDKFISAAKREGRA